MEQNDGIFRIDDTTVYVLMDTTGHGLEVHLQHCLLRHLCLGQAAGRRALGLSLQRHRSHLVHRLPHHLPHTLLVPGA